MPPSAPRVSLYPQIEFPADPGLAELPKLFDPAWVWEEYCQHFGRPEIEPDSIHVRQFSHRLARNAIVSYDVEWSPDQCLPTSRFVAKVEPKKPIEIFRFPEDDSLPGLSEAARPETAVTLLNKHVLPVGARRVLVEVIRYRPGSRAVLRHGVGRLRFYVRVMRPAVLPTWLATWEPVARSDFVAPRLAGCWNDGGLLWISEMPGKNLRGCIRRGNQPDLNLLLDGLESLWSAPPDAEGLRPFNLWEAYQSACRYFNHYLPDDAAAQRNLERVTDALDPFARGWRPTCIAHNDFYDDQMLLLPDGRVALVDFEETGPGDPMLDAGNFLAHLTWAAHFGSGRVAAASGAYHDAFRNAALARFGWGEPELNLRTAICLFRVCTNAVRHPRPDWRQRFAAGLSLVNEILT